jgi:hypothetical protein
MGKPDHTSFSTLDSFDTCPLRHLHERVIKTPTIPNKLMIEGMLAAKVFELYTQELYQSSADRYPAAIPDLVQRVMAENERIASTEFYQGVLAIAMTFAKNFVMDPDAIIEVEMKLEMPLGDGYPKLLTFIDRVERAYDKDGGFILFTDDKAGWAKTQKPSNVFQLEVEALQLHHRFPDERITGRNYFARHNVHVNYGGKDEFQFFTEWDYERAIGRVKAIYDRLQRSFDTREWPANPGDHCAFCSVAQMCDVLKKLTETKQIVATVESGELLVREALTLEAALKNTKGALKKYVDAAGPLRLPSGLGADYVTSNASLVLSDLARAYDALGDELWDLVKPDGTALKKYQDDPRLDGCWTEKPGRREFKVGKFGASEEVEE